MSSIGISMLFLSFFLSALSSFADPIPPAEVSKKIFGINRYESEDLASYRLSVNSSWGTGIRVNLGPGENLEIAPKKFVLYENRYFFVNTPRNNITKAFDLGVLFGGRKDVTFSSYQKLNDTKAAFVMHVNKSFMWKTIIVNCRGTTEISGINIAKNSDYQRFQLRLEKCDINGRTTLVEDAWMTLDAFRFDSFSTKSALTLKALYFNEAKVIEGRSYNEKQVSELVLGVEDELLVSLFGKLGYKVDKAQLWRHQM